MADSATEAYCQWFTHLAPAIADELAAALVQLFPGGALETPLVIERPSDGLVSRIRRLASSPHKDAGTALTLASLTDFVFLEYSEGERFERTDAMLELLDQAKESLGAPEVEEQLSEFIEQSKLRQPLRSRQWKKEAETWAELRSGALDPERIRESVRDALLEGFEPPRS